jgi:pimeloyl-ACP methyl ester carboxylesterase
VPIIALHGFGQDASVWQHVALELNPDFILYSFELPFHGKYAEYSYSEAEINSYYIRSLSVLVLELVQDEKFILIGFSLGARIAQMLYMCKPDAVRELVFIAPDGFSPNWIYKVASSTLIGNALLKFIIKHPKAFFKSLDILKGGKWFNKSVIRFAELQMNSIEKRQLVYSVWIGLKGLKVKTSLFQKVLIYHGTPYSFIIGRYDRVVTRQQIMQSMKGISDSNIAEISVGHHQLLTKGAGLIAKRLNSSCFY